MNEGQSMWSRGTIIVCVHASQPNMPENRIQSAPLIKGAYYTVRKCLPADPNNKNEHSFGVLLNEIFSSIHPPTNLEYAFLNTRFREAESSHNEDEQISAFKHYELQKQ